jgi:hypothetical protein
VEKEQLKKLIVQHLKEKTGRASVLRLVLAEYEKYEHAKKPVLVEQVIRKLIASNNECLSVRLDAKLEEENLFLKTLLPNYLSVAELRDKLEPLGLEKTGASMGKAISYLRSNGLCFLPEDVKEAING